MSRRRGKSAIEVDLNLPKKKQRLASNLNRQFAIYFGLCSVAAVGAAAVIAVSSVRRTVPAQVVTPVAGEVRIALSGVEPGKACFFECRLESRPLRFFVVGLSDGTYRAALDAAESSSAGFRQEGSSICCNGCSLRFPIDEVGAISGGCRPIPIPVSSRGDQLVLQEADLQKARLSSRLIQASSHHLIGSLYRLDPRPPRPR
jgi:uncharacterized membrane protein